MHRKVGCLREGEGEGGMKSTEKMKNSKPQWSIKLPCLCLIAATMAFTMGLLTAPLLNISAKVISSSDPSRQLIKQLWPDSPTNQVVMEAKTTLQASTSGPISTHTIFSISTLLNSSLLYHQREPIAVFIFVK